MLTRVLTVIISVDEYPRDKYFPQYNSQYATKGKNGVELVQFIGCWVRYPGPKEKDECIHTS